MGMNVNVFAIHGRFLKIIFLCLHAVTCRQQTERVSLKMEMKKDTEEKGHTGGDGWSLPLACNPRPKWIVGVAQAWSLNQYVAACVDVQLCFVPRKGENTLPDTVDIQGASDHLGMIGDRGNSMVIPRSPPQPFGTRIEKWSSCSLGESLVFSLPTTGCMLISSYFPPGQSTPFFLSPQLQLPWLRLAVAFQALDGFCSWNVTFLACIVINWSDTQNSIARFWILVLDRCLFFAKAIYFLRACQLGEAPVAQDFFFRNIAAVNSMLYTPPMLTTSTTSTLYSQSESRSFLKDPLRRNPFAVYKTSQRIPEH